MSESDLNQPRDQNKSGFCAFHSYFHRAQVALPYPSPRRLPVRNRQIPRNRVSLKRVPSLVIPDDTPHIILWSALGARGASMGVLIILSSRLGLPAGALADFFGKEFGSMNGQLQQLLPLSVFRGLCPLTTFRRPAGSRSTLSPWV